MNADEKITVEKMIRIYCRSKHLPNDYLCDDCKVLNDYASQRLSRCTFGENKPTCEKCPIHCYKIAMKEQIQIVMRFAGPRMILYHPILAIRHLIKNKRKK